MKLRRLMIAVDETTLGTDVLDVAAELGRCTGAEVALVVVADVRSVGASEIGPPLRVTAAKLRQEAEGVLTQAERQLGLSTPPLLLVKEGLPDQELIAAARDWHADLLIIGSHMRTGLAHLFKGSVAESVLHHAPCPVLIVKIGASKP